ncbi:MAG: DNA recombination protein RmuC [Bacteroidota bacterium]
MSVLLLGIVLGICLGGLFSYVYFKFGKKGAELVELKKEKDFLARSKHEILENRDILVQEKESLNDRLFSAREENARLRQKQQDIEERMKEVEERKKKTQEDMHREFQLLAHKIFDEKSEKFDKSSQKSLDAILNPLKEKIKTFENRVEKIYSEENKERINLKAEVKQLTELNRQLSQEANNLTSALKGDNKIQGNWGEMILESVLESSGLEKGREYTFQYSEEDEHGKPKRPDVVVKLPDAKHIIIDSKVSLLAYEKLNTAAEKESKERFVKEHIASIKNHIKGLSEKNYQNLANLNTPDFVLMFLPIEGSLGLAANEENLWSYAWDRKIVLVSPSTLLATLRTVASIWKHENQNLNAIEIATQAGRMLDKFSDFTEDMLRLGKQMDTSKKSYESAMNKLVEGRGNLITKSEQLKKLGVKTQKQIDKRLIDKSNTGIFDEGTDY